MLARPKMDKMYPDFTEVAINACKTEVKTLAYELKNCMSRHAHIMTLESRSLSTENVKNENIELIPRINIQYKVSIKERIAPLRLKFEFFDSTTRKRLRDPDTIVCVSPTIECPTMDNASVIKTGPDFKNPYIVLFKELQDKMIPEFYNAATKKDKHPQTVYLSLKSISGCFCTITVSFPCERKALLK